ncbi:hypothetical protein [Aquisalimonas sp.]|uniref:hypothetical protein n=1 Tax=Aquisalimonas sp. TaxID=1872621 RepID=UPI0025C4C4D6|nr:hypothetical protein [Aquisalimonas sp.]
MRERGYRVEWILETHAHPPTGPTDRSAGIFEILEHPGGTAGSRPSLQEALQIDPPSDRERIGGAVESSV